MILGAILGAGIGSIVIGASLTGGTFIEQFIHSHPFSTIGASAFIGGISAGIAKKYHIID